MWQRPYSLSHNRLTHSLKVGQVARRLAQYLLKEQVNQEGIRTAGGLDPDVAELGGRTHDLGHSPFGHIGEMVLDRIAIDNGLPDGFEGNAQSFRILTFLQRELRDGMPVQGMDLTRISTAAIVKYPWPRGTSGKTYDCLYSHAIYFSLSACFFYNHLENDRKWIRRRVETIEFASEITINKRLTLDIDFDQLSSLMLPR